MNEGARLSTSMLISLLIHLVLISLWLIISAISPPEEPETLHVVLAPADPPPAVDASDSETDTTRSPETPETGAETPAATPQTTTETRAASDPPPTENNPGSSTDSRSQPSGGSPLPETAMDASENNRAEDAAGRTRPPTIPDDPDPLDWQVPREREERSSTDLSGFLGDDEQSERDRQLEEWRNSNSAGETAGSDRTPGRETAPPRSDTGEEDPGERGPDPELAERLAAIREQSRSSDSTADSDQSDGTSESPSENPADDQTRDPARDPGDSSAESLRRQGISGEILQQGRDLIREDRLDLGQYLDQRDLNWPPQIRLAFTVDSDGFVTILNPESYSAYNQLSRAIERLFAGQVFQPDPGAPPVGGSIVFQIR